MRSADCLSLLTAWLAVVHAGSGPGGSTNNSSTNVGGSRLPNIILFLVDDLGYGDLGFTGHPATRTPNLDYFASQGRRLTNWYTAYPVCSASRTAVLTGRQPPRVGMVGVINSLSKVGLPLSETTIADELRGKAGYATLALGKWHQGQTPSYLPAARGFDEFYGLPFSVDDGAGTISSCDMAAPASAAVQHPQVDLGPSLPLPRLRQVNGTNVIEQQPADLVPLTASWVNHTVDFLQRKVDSTPVFVYFAFGHVHTTGLDQMQYSGCDWVGSTSRGTFGDALAEVDGAVGTVLAEIERLGQAANTLSIFFSDNGPAERWGVQAGDVGIFRGGAAVDAQGISYMNTGKGSTWEGGVRMPAFAYWPGTVEAGTVSGTVVSSMDILPSLVRLARIEPAATVLDGKDSLLDAVLRPTSKGDALSNHTFLPFYNNVYIANASREIYAARFGRFKVHWITSPGLLTAGQVAEELAHDPPIVFDVEADPAEMYPLDPALDFLEAVAFAKAEYEANLTPSAIDPTYGYEWALCCGIGCTPNEEGSCECTCSDVGF